MLIQMSHLIVIQNCAMFKIILFAAITLLALSILAEVAAMIKEVEGVKAGM